MAPSESAPQCTLSLHLSGQEGALCFIDSSLEPKAAIDEQDVIVNRLGHPDHAALELLLPALHVDCVRCRIAT